MKIPLSLRTHHEILLENHYPLKIQVDRLVLTHKHAKWHYESRIKTIESFALKLETGRFDPSGLEDFFACTLVVENPRRINDARQLVIDHFQLIHQRPRTDSFTHKNSDSFPFDDLRLYVKLPDDPRLPPTTFNDILFEIQIKTFLQHAWSIATHDLIYKSESKNWATERIAYQIKAMLEHAELSIITAEQLSETDEMKKTNAVTNQITKAISLIKEFWKDSSNLPTDMIRLAQNTLDLCEKFEIKLSKLKKILTVETAGGRGSNMTNLSPYGIILQSIIFQSPELLLAYCSDDPPKVKIFLPKEVQITDALKPYINTHFISV